MKRVIAGLLLTFPCAIFADSTPDASFYKHAAEGGLSEVELGGLAQQKSGNERVKEFGAMMVKDHSAANEKLRSLATSKNISLPTGAGMAATATKAKLEVLSGNTFDKSYIKGMIKDHQDDIVLFKKEIASGTDPDAKAFATSTLPTLRSHLKAIKSIAAENGVNAGE